MSISTTRQPLRQIKRTRSLGQVLFPSVVTGLLGGVIGFVLGWALANRIGGSGAGDFPVSIGFLVGFLGFMIGIGAFAYPMQWALCRPELSHEQNLILAGKDDGVWRYFRFCTDHKVIGVQYLVLTFAMFIVGGLGAMLIRVELMYPGARYFPPMVYNSVVGMHGIAMIAGTITMFLGPFANFVVPIMVGARDMAFPRMNALSFWTLFPAVLILLCVPFLGGFPTGWTAYAPLADQAPAGMDAFVIALVLAGLSSMMGAVNILTTVITMRAPGMTWTRLPIFVWGVISGSIIAAFATPAFAAALVLIGLDRLVGTNFYVASQGGSSWLYINLFWFFGHPEVYLIAVPALAAILEMMAVFSRKPLFGYRTAAISMLTITGISFLVWAHHNFVSGFDPELRGPFMLTTEIISVPTGVVFLAALGTLWRGRIWLTTAMLFCVSFLWNFVIGGITGLYLADVPSDIQLHGSLFVTAHFHYTLMGGALMGFFAAVYYWFPKMTGRMLDETLGKVHFWTMQVCFNGTFLLMFYVGLLDMPRRVADYTPRFATANFWTSIFAFGIGVSVMIFAYNVVASWIGGRTADANPWRGQTLEWQLPTPVPLENFEHLPTIVSGPYEYGVSAAAQATTTHPA